MHIPEEISQRVKDHLTDLAKITEEFDDFVVDALNQVEMHPFNEGADDGDFFVLARKQVDDLRSTIRNLEQIASLYGPN